MNQKYSSVAVVNILFLAIAQLPPHFVFHYTFILQWPPALLTHSVSYTIWLLLQKKPHVQNHNFDSLTVVSFLDLY